MLKLFIIRVAFFKNATFIGAFMQREVSLLIMNN